MTAVAVRDVHFHARLAGVGYLGIIVCGIFAEFFVRGSLVVAGDPAATAAALAGSEGFYRTGIAAEFLMLGFDVLLALSLYVVFREVDRNLALLAAFFRLTHAAIVGVNLLNTWVPLLLLGEATWLGAFEPAQLQALSLLLLEVHSFGYVIGLVFFGFHLLVLAHLVHHSGYFPRVLGILLLVAGVAYLFDGFGRTLFPAYMDHEALLEMVVFTPAFLGELSFCLWLLLKGVRLPAAREAMP